MFPVSLFTQSLLRWLPVPVIVSIVVVITIVTVAAVLAVIVVVPETLSSPTPIDEVTAWNVRNEYEVSVLLAR